MRILIKKWNWNELSKNPNISIQDVINHPELRWNWEYVSINPNITIQTVIDHPELRWSLRALPWNPSISFQDLVKSGFPLAIFEISWHPELTWQNVLDNKPDRWWYWDWTQLSKNPNITLKNVMDHPHFDWNWAEVSKKVDGVFVKYNKKRVDLGLEEDLYFPSKEKIEEIDEMLLQYQYRIGGEKYNESVDKLK